MATLSGITFAYILAAQLEAAGTYLNFIFNHINGGRDARVGVPPSLLVSDQRPADLAFREAHTQGLALLEGGSTEHLSLWHCSLIEATGSL